MSGVNGFFRYTVDEDAQAKKTFGGVYLLFDRLVSVTKTGLSVNEMTLLTRVGGIVGVGKELLWIILFSITYCITMYNYVASFLV